MPLDITGNPPTRFTPPLFTFEKASNMLGNRKPFWNEKRKWCSGVAEYNAVNRGFHFRS